MSLRNRENFKDYRCFFITTTCNNFFNLFKSEEYFKILYHSFDFLNKKYVAHLSGYVFMPNHIHVILYFENENRLSDYMRDFKKYTSGEIRRLIEKEQNDQLIDKLRFERRGQKFKIWKDRFDDVVLYTRKILEIKLEYIHNNPIKAGFVESPIDYRHSSAGFYFEGKIAPIEILHYFEIM